ncbi:MAG: hypothetical protein LQ338_003012 [Usnochroma carphineum]|nr:MAG: hypothetical protein LQ338_003012 [Usnochroma carphineum]
MASRPTSSRAPTGTAANPARRNLFHGHHLIRRPTGASTSAGAANAPSVTSMPEMRYNDTSDVVMRDSNGEPQVQTPQLLSVEDEQAATGNEEGLHNEKERLEERLIETYKSRSFVPGDKMELFTAVQASLRRKVAALDEDNWMFEAEEAQPG